MRPVRGSVMVGGQRLYLIIPLQRGREYEMVWLDKPD